ncbi:hypothetical protein XarbCFBP7629_10555 [Xanthomonas arboricola]|nr:hypothetical protein XarbCFBP7629_10555 [Xanthomonas arboricola]
MTGPCPPTVAGPYAAWMPRKSLQGCTCGVPCDGGRARALQQGHRAVALTSIYQHCPATPTQPRFRKTSGCHYPQMQAITAVTFREQVGLRKPLLQSARIG